MCVLGDRGTPCILSRNLLRNTTRCHDHMFMSQQGLLAFFFYLGAMGEGSGWYVRVCPWATKSGYDGQGFTLVSESGSAGGGSEIWRKTLVENP